MGAFATDADLAVTADTIDLENPDDLRVALADELAFRRWYERHVPAVYAYLASRCLGDRDLVQELTQQTFIAAIGTRSGFDRRSAVTTWLLGIARHKLADHFRALEREEARRARARVREIELVTDAGAWRGAEDRVLIADAMRALPAAQRAVLTFVAIDDLPVAEVARLIGRSFGATQSLLARARDGFRRAYPRGVEP
jgi:RNA polymerase sigma-70 factor (ECF subfamily)